MKIKITLALFLGVLSSCGIHSEEVAAKANPDSNLIIGTWQLLTATLIEKGDTVVTDYNTGNISFIKIINDTHFSFLQHDLKKGKDSAVFVAGGGAYSLSDSLYTEPLEYCSAREWEGNDFTFTVTVNNDTIVQQGIEKVESAGVNRLNIEKYVRVKK